MHEKFCLNTDEGKEGRGRGMCEEERKEEEDGASVCDDINERTNVHADRHGWRRKMKGGGGRRRMR